MTAFEGIQKRPRKGINLNDPQKNIAVYKLTIHKIEMYD